MRGKKARKDGILNKNKAYFPILALWHTGLKVLNLI